MQALLTPLPYELDPDSFLPGFHRLWGLLDDYCATILQYDVPLHLTMPATTSLGTDSACIQCRDDLVNAVIDALDTTVDRHADLMLEGFFTPR